MAKAPRVIMEKRGTRLQFCGDIQHKLYDAWVAGLQDGQIVDVTLGKHRHEKTLKQLGYWYAVLMPFACETLREAGHDSLFDIAVGKLKTGVATTPDTCDLLFKTLYAAHKQLGNVPLKRNMTDEEMSGLIEFTLDWLARNLGAIAPTPDTKGNTDND